MNSRIISQDIAAIIDRVPQLQKLSGKTLVISGGAGFLGSYILRTIAAINKSKLKNPCRVISIDNYMTGSKMSNNNVFPGGQFVFLEQDIQRPLSITQRVDYVIHAAGVASPVYYQKYPLETIETTIWGVKNLLELAKKKRVKSFLYFSSSEIYGDPDPSFVPTPEDYLGNVSSIGNRACYDESKRLGETITMTYWRLFKTPTKIVRPFNVFGPGMKPTDYRVIPTFLYRGLKNQYLPVHDHGNQTRTFCYVSDAVVGFLLVLLAGKSGEVYNVGNSENEINMMSLAEIVSQLFPQKKEVRTINYPSHYPSDEPRRRCPDLKKIKSTLGYRPEIELKAGLKRTLRWYKENYQQ